MGGSLRDADVDGTMASSGIRECALDMIGGQELGGVGVATGALIAPRSEEEEAEDQECGDQDEGYDVGSRH
jgi:hypothetical protein